MYVVQGGSVKVQGGSVTLAPGGVQQGHFPRTMSGASAASLPQALKSDQLQGVTTAPVGAQQGIQGGQFQRVVTAPAMSPAMVSALQSQAVMRTPRNSIDGSSTGGGSVKVAVGGMRQPRHSAPGAPERQINSAPAASSTHAPLQVRQPLAAQQQARVHAGMPASYAQQRLTMSQPGATAPYAAVKAAGPAPVTAPRVTTVTQQGVTVQPKDAPPGPKPGWR